MIKLVGFDLDGTIGDTIPMCIEAFREAVAPYAGHALADEEIVQTFGLNEEGMVRRVAGERWEEALEDFYEVYERMHDRCPRPFDGMAELIEELKRHGIAVALVTGKGERSCGITLRRFGMASCFGRIETGSPERNRKAEALADLMAHYGIGPDEMVYVGDALSDITACREAGVRCLSAAWAVPPDIAERQEAENPGAVFPSVGALRDHLQKSGCLDERSRYEI
ncbi:MAG: HAD family hydrolase [Rikenellaceae bacterium]|nr:HAD family hydrolase [Rikenellaceae bacterium]